MAITVMTASRIALAIRLLKARPHRIVDLCTAIGMTDSKYAQQEIRHLIYAFLEQGHVLVAENALNPRERTYLWRDSR